MVDEEFDRRHQITMKSDNVPTLYFVDICVASIIKYSRKADEGDVRRAKRADSLKRFNKPQNSFSYLLALLEKVYDTRSKLSDPELLEQILQDVAALRAFFDKARVIESDEIIFKYFNSLRGEPQELKRDNYINFLRDMNDDFKLGNPVAKPHRLNKAKEILKRADALLIARPLPVVLVALACLYGNSSAKKVMKFKADPKQFDAENALADIMTVRKFHLMKRLLVKEFGEDGSTGKPSFRRHDYLTVDSGLAGIIKCFEAVSLESKQKGENFDTRVVVDIDFKTLFPELLPQTEGETEIVEGMTQSKHSEFKKLCDLLSE